MPNSAGVAVVGIGETRNARHLPGEMSAWILDAVLLAAEDAGIEPSEIDGIVTESFTMPTELSDIVTVLGLRPDVFVANVAFSGAGTVAAPDLAAMAIETGRARNVLCYYGANYGSLLGGPFSFHGADPFKATFEIPFGLFPQPAYMAIMAQRYLEEFGYSEDEFAHVAMTARAWAAMHPDATKREGLTLEQYRQSTMVATPLRNADCALLSDGAAAFIMTSSERARDLRQPPVTVASCSHTSDPISLHSHLAVREDLLSLPSRVSGPAALRKAGLSVHDIDVFELYDCFSIIPLITLEDIGLHDRGASLEAFVKGDMLPGGATPLNTHGGLTAHSYLLGVSHFCEAVTQLRGAAGERQVPGAQHALVTGWAANEMSTCVLTNAV